MAVAATPSRLGKWRSHLIRPEQRVHAVLDDDLWPILGELALLAPLDNGELVCLQTGVRLTRDNVGGIVVTEDGPQLIADPSRI